MTRKQRILIVLMCFVILAFLTLGCDDNWDGMDRKIQPTPTDIWYGDIHPRWREEAE